MTPVVQEALAAHGLNPRMAPAIIAQMALETGYGRSMPGNNVGGIKADASWRGPSASLATNEFVGGQMVSMPQRFRSYSSLDDGVRDYVAFLVNNPRYSAALRARTPAEFFSAMGGSGYATDPAYSSKLASTFSRMYGGG